jgi:hypothetical protein
MITSQQREVLASLTRIFNAPSKRLPKAKAKNLFSFERLSTLIMFIFTVAIKFDSNISREVISRLKVYPLKKKLAGAETRK